MSSLNSFRWDFFRTLFVAAVLAHVFPALAHSQSGWIRQGAASDVPYSGVSFVSGKIGTVVGGRYTPILRTTDGGTTWLLQESSTTEVINDVSFANADTGTAVGLYGTIQHTTNGGATWTPQAGGTYDWWYGVSFADARHGTVVGASGAILHTTDGGTTWAGQESGTTEWLTAVSFVSPSIGTAVGGGGMILRTTDGGATWVSQESGTSTWLLGVSFVNADTGTVVGDQGVILRTTDGGATWMNQTAPFPAGVLYGVSLADANTGTAVGGGGVILRTTDGGAHWARQISGTSVALRDVSLSGPDTGTVVGEYGTILHTTTGGVIPPNWPVMWTGSGLSGMRITALEANASDVLFAGTDSAGVFRSNDIGHSWAPINNGLENHHVLSLWISPDQTIFAETDSGVFASPDGGDGWNSLGAFPGEIIGIDGQSRVYAGNLQVSTDAGVSWTPLSSPGHAFDMQIALSGTMMAALRYTQFCCSACPNQWWGLSTSRTGGTTWQSEYWDGGSCSTQGTAIWGFAKTNRRNRFYMKYVGGMTTYDDQIRVIWHETIDDASTLLTNSVDEPIALRTRQDTRGVYRRNGSTWEEININGMNDDPSVTCIAILSGDFLFAGTRDSGVYRSVQPVILAGMENPAETPLRYTLEQNYPNPFNPSTVIKYQLLKASYVELTLYDVLGRKCGVLVDGFEEAGEHQVSLDAERLPSGVYFYALRSGEFWSVKKLVVMR